MFHRARNVFIAVFVILFALSFAAAGPAGADEITDAIEEAVDAYRKGDHSTAVENLQFATQLIQQMKGESLKSYLPEPLEGWEAEAASSQAIGAAMMGGGLTAARSYSRGDSRVTVNFVADSPMLQSFIMMLANPMLAASDGGKLEKIGGQKALVKYDPSEKEGDIRIVVANRFLITVEGSGVSREDLKAYAGAVDYDKLSEMP